MSISMSMQAYEGLMLTLAKELTEARGLGREEGVRAMEVVVHQLTDLSKCIGKAKDCSYSAAIWELL